MSGASPARPAIGMVCAGCGYAAANEDPFPIRCKGGRSGDDIDHVMARRLEPGVAAWPEPGEASQNPFVRYRRLFRAWYRARAAGWPDERYVALVEELDAAIERVDGTGFRITPLVSAPALAVAAGLGDDGVVRIKDDTANVSGSHKARHLAGVMLELLVAERTGARSLEKRPLAIASCGNAALAAAVVARAAERPLDVFVLPGADAAVMARLEELGARTRVCGRDGSPGDPSVRAMQAAVADGAIPFTCQGNENGLAIEGGQTIGWELADQLAEAGDTIDTLAVQVGGGALASAAFAGLAEAHALGRLERLPRLVAVQTHGGFPLARAWARVAGQAVEELDWDGERLDLAVPAVSAFLHRIAHHRSGFMWAWETEPESVAHGILDDETYDWLAVVRGMLATGGRTVLVDEAVLRDANDLASRTTGIPADHTGTAGLAGVLELARDGALRPAERIGVLFTGVRRDLPRDAVHPPAPVIPPERRGS